MAMTKKKKAEMEAAKTAAALRWTEPVEPDLPVPALGSGLHTQGWEFNAYSKRVTAAWSEPARHGYGSHDHQGNSSGWRGGIPLHSTKALALKALRHALERQAAEALRAVDLQIEEAMRETKNA